MNTDANPADYIWSGMLKALLEVLKDILKEILGKLALLILFLLLFAGASALTRGIFRRLHYDNANEPYVSDHIATYIAAIGSLAIMGLVIAVHHTRKKSKAMREQSSSPPTTLASVSSKPRVPPPHS